MLDDLLHGVDVVAVRGNTQVAVTGIAGDSREVRTGFVFVARRGRTHDGRHFIAEAIARGAAVVVSESSLPDLGDVTRVEVSDARVALAEIANAFYGFPSQTLGVVGVTGTDGKTTTTHLIAEILNVAGIPSGLLSTVAIEDGQQRDRNRTSQTTPEAPVIQRSLATMREAGRRVAAVEVSSHALVTARVHGCVFDCAVFTNLDPEHLDFHRSLRAYRSAKASLFAQLGFGLAKEWGRLGVVNADDPNHHAMLAACPVPTTTFGFSETADLRPRIIHDSLDETAFELRVGGDRAVIQTVVTGRYNVLNWLAASAAARHFGASLTDVARAAQSFTGVPGRMQPVLRGLPFRVYVDFAHTPQALEKAIQHLRRNTRGRVIVLFGQAGGRDLGNRARMARAVAGNADLAIVTSDDPYDEDPQSIVDDLGRALTAEGWLEGRQFWRIVDRAAAIDAAIDRSRRGDVVLLAGRGPEDTQVIGSQRIALVDADVARVALSRRLAG
jgi:UDP-N-acetylmuramoyl-L-alanyl-D-glutamate--2,6-diaminopimelate ligase